MSAVPRFATEWGVLEQKSAKQGQEGWHWLCPYGCGQHFVTGHSKCQNELLGNREIILEKGLLGALPLCVYAELGITRGRDKVGATKKCQHCQQEYQYHVQCGGKELPVEEQIHSSLLTKATVKRREAPTAPKPTAISFPPNHCGVSALRGKFRPEGAKVIVEDRYHKVADWYAPLAVRIGKTPYNFDCIAVLAEWMLEECPAYIVCSAEQSYMDAFENELRRTGELARVESFRDPKSKSFLRFGIRGVRKWVVLPIYAGLSSFADYQRANKPLYQLTGTNLSEKETLGEYGYEYWLKGLREPIYPLIGDDYAFATRANYGGMKYWKDGHEVWMSKEAERTRKYEEILADPTSDALVQVDLSSCYPFVQLNAYPKCEHQRLNDAVAAEAAYHAKQHGLYEVTFTCPPNLKRPILPLHGTPTKWLTEGSGRDVYTEVDLQLAESKGYKLQFSGAAVVWAESSTTLFSDFVNALCQLKADYEDDKPVRKVMKGIANTMAGKLAQKVSGGQDINRVEIAEEKYDEYLFSGDPVKVVAVSEDHGKFFLQQEGGMKKQNTHPNHLNSYVLSYSRVLLNQLFDLLDYNMKFVSTDAFRVSVQQYHRLRETGWIHPTAIGKLKVERLILGYAQSTIDDYEVLELTPEGKRISTLKGAVDRRKVQLPSA